jgi:hypothetical protein
MLFSLVQIVWGRGRASPVLACSPGSDHRIRQMLRAEYTEETTRLREHQKVSSPHWLEIYGPVRTAYA